MSRRVLIIMGSAGASLVLLVGAAFGVASSRSDQVIDGVTVASIDVGGLDRDAAMDELASLVEERSAEAVIFVHDDVEHVVDPVEVGVAVDLEALVDEALAAGRDGSFLGDRWSALSGVEQDVRVDVALDDDALTRRIAAIAREVDAETFAGDVTVDPVSLTVTPELPVTGKSVDQDAAVTAAAEAFRTPGIETLDLPVEVTEPWTDAEDVADAVDAAEAAIDGDLTLQSADGQVVLTPREIAALLSTEVVGDETDATLRVVITPDAVEAQLLELLEPLTVTPINATYSASSNPGVRFDDKDDAVWRPVPASVDVVAGRNGTSVDPEMTAEQLTRTIAGLTRTVTLDLVVDEPAFSDQMARDANIDTLLSTFTSYHACCQTRVQNIQRLANMVDKTLVLPGEQFSINQISGVRACSKGFAAAGMILNGEIVDSCGGGVSQFGTTTINAVFFAGLKPDAYKPHSFYISRYPMAREATLNYPSPDIDVRFTNDTGAPILIRTAHTSTSITVSFYGSSDVTEVRANVGSPTNIKPFKIVRRVNRELPAGVETRIQGGQDGFYVSLTRTVTRGSSESSDDWSNTYVPETEIYEYNPDEPEPEPTEDPTTAPTEDPTTEPDPGDSPSDDPSEA